MRRFGKCWFCTSSTLYRINIFWIVINEPDSTMVLVRLAVSILLSPFMYIAISIAPATFIFSELTCTHSNKIEQKVIKSFNAVETSLSIPTENNTFEFVNYVLHSLNITCTNSQLMAVQTHHLYMPHDVVSKSRW